MEKKTGIKVNIFDGVVDKKVTLNITALPLYAIHTFLEKMELENFAVVYDKELASKVIYILPKGTDISEVVKGKTIIKPARFADGTNVNQIKSHEITTITRGKNNISIRYVKDELLLKFYFGDNNTPSLKRIVNCILKHERISVTAYAQVYYLCSIVSSKYNPFCCIFICADTCYINYFNRYNLCIII